MFTIKLTYFGVFQLEVNGQLIANFRTEKTAALLAYLVLEGQTPISRTRLTELLWHGYEKKAAQASLRVALTHIRQMLGPTLKATRKYIHFDSTDLQLWRDIDALAATASTELPQVSSQQLTEHLALYRGEFLEGWELVDSAPFQEWLQQRRAYYQNIVATLRQQLTLRSNKVPYHAQHNLPRRLTPLFGHTKAVTQLRQLLLGLQHPLLTLIGEGGIGKTRLALAAAWSLTAVIQDGPLPPFSDGLWFVPLSDLNPAADLSDQLATAIGMVCGISFTTTTSLTIQLRYWLSTKALLLILDSFEHLTAASDWLNSLLQAAPQVKILVTSRQRLNLQAAMVVPVDELALPALDLPFTVEKLLTYPSVQLFMERGQRVRPSFQLHDDNVADVVQICRQMAGLPLGIELAATLLLLYSPAQIAAQLKVNTLSLRTEWLDWPARHHSIEEVLTTSWRLLSPDEAALLARLTVIKGNFTVGEAITIGDAQPATLFALVNKSLLRQTADEEYFTMHDLVRTYALSQLQQQPLLETSTHRRHAAYYLALVAAEEATLPNTRTAQTRLMNQIDNIRAAWAWSIAQGEVTLWAQASNGLIWLYRMVGLSQEAVTALRTAANALRDYMPTTAGSEQYQPLLAHLLVGIAEFSPYAEREQLLQEALFWGARGDDANSQGAAYYELSNLARIRGDFKAMLAYAQQAHTCAEQSGQPQPQLSSLLSLAMAYYFQDDFTAVLATVDELWGKLKQTPNRDLESLIFTHLGHFYTDIDNFGKGLHCLRQAFVSAWRIKPVAINEVYLRLGRLYSELGFWSAAQMLYRHSLNYYEQTQHFYYQVLIHHGLGSIDYATGNLSIAYNHFNTALQITRQHGIAYWEYLVLIDLGDTLAALGIDQAATCFEQAIRLGESWKKYSALGRAYVGLAKLALRQDDRRQAALAVEHALTYWHKNRTDHAEPRRFYWHCYEVLYALGDPRAQTILQQGYTNLIKTANTLSDPFLRHSFLEAVPINCALLAAVQFNGYDTDAYQFTPAARAH